MTVRCASIVSHVEFELLHQKDSHQRPAQYNAQHTTHKTQHTAHSTQHSRYGTFVKIFKSYLTRDKTYRSAWELLLTVHLVACM